MPRRPEAGRAGGPERPPAASSVPAIGYVALGCAKAQVDAERMLSALRAAGYRFVADPEEADLVVVNTCGFLVEAEEESFAAIGEALAACPRVVATGCLGTRAEKLRARFPELLGVFGPEAFTEALACIFEALPPPAAPQVEPLPRRELLLTPGHYAWLKIAEGCNHDCSFCIIPGLRGPLRSRPVDALVAEAGALAAAGVKELLVVAQDTAAYGMDVRHRTGFVQGRPVRTDLVHLVKELARIVPWVRVHYVYPYPLVDRLVEAMAEGIVLPYLDMPLQHASPKVLARMRRPRHAERMLERLARWRRLVPELVVRTSLIVGFPGETDADFAMLLDFLRAAELDRVGAFVYSPVEGAAANRLPDPVPRALAEERLAELMRVQAGISRKKLARRVGKRVQVLVDARLDEQTAIARSYGEAPEVDGVIHVRDGGRLRPGAFAEVVIEDAEEHDLWAVPVEEAACA